MTVIIEVDIDCKQCPICRQEIGNSGVAILLTMGDSVVALHPLCAKGISLDLLRDLSTLTRLGYEVE